MLKNFLTQASKKDDREWKTNFDGRQPFMKDDILWNMFCDGRPILIENGIQWKTTFKCSKQMYKLFFQTKQNKTINKGKLKLSLSLSFAQLSPSL